MPAVFDVITCAQFWIEFLGVTVLHGVEFPIFLLVLAWALQQCGANALPVINCIVERSLCFWNSDIMGNVIHKRSSNGVASYGVAQGTRVRVPSTSNSSIRNHTKFVTADFIRFPIQIRLTTQVTLRIGMGPSLIWQQWQIYILKLGATSRPRTMKLWWLQNTFPLPPFGGFWPVK